MNPKQLDRRDFFQKAGLSLASLSVMNLSLIKNVNAQSKELPLELFFSADDLDKIREKTKLPLFKDYWLEQTSLDHTDDINFLKNDLSYNNHIRHFARARQILEREAFLYIVTKSARHGELAYLAATTLLKYKKWDYHVEDKKYVIGLQRAPEGTIAMSMAYDWCYDLFSDQERKEILKSIGDKGCEACYLSLWGMRHPDKVKGWGYDPEGSYHADVDMSRWPYFFNGINLKAVPFGGLAVGAAALMNTDKRAAKWFEMVLYSYKNFVNNFEADGSYNEGGSYWNYTASHMALVVEMFARKKNMGLFDDANYVGMMEFLLALQMPHSNFPHETVNFGDSGSSFDSGLGFWIARNSRDGLCQYIALNHARGHNNYSLIWYDPTIIPIKPTPKFYFKHFDLDWIITRNGYESRDLVVAMRSGKPSNHEHGDRNSVVLKAYDEVLLADYKHPTYNAKDPGWLLRTPVAHNTVLIDGQGHQYHKGEEGTNASKASAKIVRRGDRGKYVFWASDATQAYKIVIPDVKSVTRTVLVFESAPFILVLDKLIKENEPSVLSANWHIENKDNNGSCIVDGNSFVIERPLAEFYTVCGGSQPVTAYSKTLPLPKESGVCPLVSVESTVKEKNPFMILAGCPMKKNEQEPIINIVKKDNYYAVEMEKGWKRIKLDIFDNGELPEFDVVEMVL